MSLSTEEIKKKSIKGVLSYGARTVVVYLVTIGATAILSALLSPADFGIYFVVTALIGLFTFMSDIGLAASLIQKKAEPTLAEYQSTFTLQQILSYIIMGIIFLGTPIWQHVSMLNKNGLYLLYALGFSFVLASLKTIPSIMLERKMEFDKIVLPQLAETLVFYLVAVWFASRGLGVASYTYAVMARSICGVVVIYILQPWNIGFRIDKTSLVNLAKFGLKFQANDLLARIKDDLFVAVLAKFVPANTMGFLGFAKRWSMFPYQFSVSSVVSIAFPTFSRLQGNFDLMKKALEKAIYFISALIFPILMMMCVMVWPLIRLLPVYAKWSPALPMLAYFCINIAIAALANPVINLLNAMGEINKTLILMIVMTLSTWIMTPIMVWVFGANGVSMASAITAAISLYAFKMINKFIRINLASIVWAQLISVVVMGICLWMGLSFWSLSWMKFGLGLLLGFAIYTGLLLVLSKNRIWHEVIILMKSNFHPDSN